MKKTTLTLLALCGVAGAAEFTSSSYITPTGNVSWSETETDVSKKDLYSISVHQTQESIREAYTAYRGASATKTAYDAVYRVRNASNTKLNSRSITLSNLYNETALDESVALVSYSFITGNVETDTITSIKVQVLDSDNKVLGTSNEVSYSFGTTADSFGVGTFSFSEAITLQSDAAYTFRLVDATTLEAYTGNVYFAEYRTDTSGGNGGKIDGQWYDGDYPVISVATKSIVNSTASESVPEPATATLSLLALAGLSVRRRRR